MKFAILLCLVATAVAGPVKVQKPYGFRENRIVGGETATPNQFPWVVSLQLLGSHICGGFIFDEVTVVTAAHCCAAGLGPFLGRAIAGDYNLISPSGDEQERSFLEVNIYPYYDGNAFNFDVCTLTVNTPFRLGEGIETKPEAAVVNTEPIGEAPVTIMGWGETEAIEASWILRTADVTAYTDEDCNASWQEAFPGAPIIGDDMICAGVLPDGGIDSCSGDSGTSMVLRDTNIVVGVTSWGLNDCAEPGTPGVYAELSYFAEWIATTAAAARARHHPNL